jgi:hypothetical protein
MSKPSISLSSTGASTVQRRFERYLGEPIDRIGFALLWSATTTSVVLGTLHLSLLIITRILPHFALIWAISFPTSLETFSGTPMGMLIMSLGFLCWMNVYSIKQTRQAYKELRVWVVSIRFSWTDRQGSQHTLHLLTAVWSKTKKNIPSVRVFALALLQCVVLAWQQAQKSQQACYSGALGIINEDEAMTAVMTTLSCEQVAVGASVSTVDPPSVACGIFGTVVGTCQIRVVGPTGQQKVIDVERRAFFPLWSYLITRTLTGGWVGIKNILEDVYGYDGVVENKKTGQMEDPKQRLLNRFHQQRSVLNKEIKSALVEVGLAPTDLLRRKQSENTSFWGIAPSIEIKDISSFQECRTLLAGASSPHRNQEASLAQVQEGCLGFSALISDPLALVRVDQTNEPWMHQLVQEVFTTYCNAINYLAKQAKAEADRASDEDAKRACERQETEYWTNYAINCARASAVLLENQQPLISQGEMALQKVLLYCIDLGDPLRAASAYQAFKDAVEHNGNDWEPHKITKACWQKVLSFNAVPVA